MIQVRIGQQDGLNRTAACLSLRGLERAEGFDLESDVGRRIQQKPAFIVGSDCDTGLSPGTQAAGSGAHLGAQNAGTIPLGKATAGCRAEQNNAHLLRTSNAATAMIVKFYQQNF